MSDRLKTWFIEFRRGGRFIQALAVFIGAWFALRAVFGFDPDYGLLNLLLSLEASIATALLLDMSVKQAASDRALIEEIRTDVEEVKEEVVRPDLSDDIC